MRHHTAVWLVLFACTPSNKADNDDCVIDSDCPDALLCVQNQCASVECYGHSDCGYGLMCLNDGTCALGCNEDAPCPAGEQCVNGECHSATCVNTELDCALGEWCLDGVCEQPDFPICQACDFEDWQQSSITNGECVIYTFDRERSCHWPDTGACPEHWSCFPLDGTGEDPDGFCVASFWYLYCSDQDGCPRGLTCDSILGDNEPLVCWADCVTLLEGGYLENE